MATLLSRTRLNLGTVITITVWHADPSAAEAAIEAAFVEVERLRGLFDRHDAATPLSVLNRQGGLADVPPELRLVLGAALDMGRRTDHAFNIAVLPVVEYLTARRNPTGELTIDPAEFAEALSLVRPGDVRLDGGARLGTPGMGITLDALAKGYIADRAATVLTAAGVENHLVNAGGDIRANGRKGADPWIAGIENPDARGQAMTAVPLRGQGLATSGGYEVFYDQARKRHHLINPDTGQSPATRSVSVTAPTAMQADALATALAILPVEHALHLARSLPDTQCLILTAENRLVASPGWG